MLKILLCYIRDMKRYGIMSRKIKLSDEEVEWLRSNHADISHRALADRYSCCVDTVKRLLMKLGLQYFSGAKYQTRPSLPVWRRPCMSCGSTDQRPKNQYRCDECSLLDFERSSKSSVEARAPYTPKVPF